MRSRTILAAAMALVLGTLSTAWGAASFEETVAVKIPRGVNDYADGLDRRSVRGPHRGRQARPFRRGGLAKYGPECP
jgi:hypothetical protein